MKQSVLVDEEGQVVAAVAGRVERLDAERARLDSLAVGEGLGTEPRGRCWVREERRPEALGQLADAVDVIRVRVRDEDVSDVDPVPLSAFGERLDDTVRVDEEPLPARPLGDEVRVREPVRVLGSLDDHAASANLITLRIPSWASMRSKPRLTSSSVRIVGEECPRRRCRRPASGRRTPAPGRGPSRLRRTSPPRGGP